MSDKAIFTTHIDRYGRLKEGKEMHDCPHCNGQCYISNETVTPSGVQILEYECTDCMESWTETY